MNFTDFDNKMRVYEQSLDQVIAPDMFMIARLDGRGFTKLTKETCKFEAPFDERFRDLMVFTAKHLMDCGFHVIYTFTESDEISLLFHPDEDAFGRKVRKFNSILAAEASVTFSMALGTPGVFDCRIIALPNEELVKDYFLWRQEDAHRNSLNSHCYWMLRKQGINARKATDSISGISNSEKNELLFRGGINYDDQPDWQKRGIGIYPTEIEKEGFNPIKNESVIVKRRTLKSDLHLPLGKAYGEMIEKMLQATKKNHGIDRQDKVGCRKTAERE